MDIVSYRKQYKKDFIALNLAWIEKYFKVEPRDINMLNNVENFLARGAAVYFAAERGEILATCMVTPVGGQVWEICKLATEERYRKKGAGSAVLGMYGLRESARRQKADDCVEYGPERSDASIRQIRVSAGTHRQPGV